MKSFTILLSVLSLAIANDITIVYSENGDYECFEKCDGPAEKCAKVICPTKVEGEVEAKAVPMQFPGMGFPGMGMGGMGGMGGFPGMGFPGMSFPGMGGMGGFPGMGGDMGNAMQYPGQPSQSNGCGCQSSCNVPCMPWWPCNPCNPCPPCEPETTTPAPLCNNGLPDSAYPYCCLNGAQNRYCCLNGADNPECTFPTLPPTVEPETTTPPNQCNPCRPCMPCMIWWMCQPCNNQCNNGCQTQAPIQPPATLPPLNNCPCICAPCQPWQPCNPCPSICPCNGI